jgi:hypothetical protein
MTSRALSGQKDCAEVSISSFSWALPVRIELAPKPMAAAAVVVVRNVLRFIFWAEQCSLETGGNHPSIDAQSGSVDA